MASIGKSFVFFLLLFSQSVMADLRLASGFSTSTGGRMIPLLYGSVSGQNAGMSLSSVGYKNTLSYHSAYQMNLFYLYHPGRVLWGELEAGFGVGGYYYEIGYKAYLSHPGVKKSNFALGPAMRVHWNLLPFLFLGFEGMYGIRGTPILFLSTQDSVSFLLGVNV